MTPITRLLVVLLAGVSLAAFGSSAEASSHHSGDDCAYVYPDPSVDPDACVSGGSGSGGGSSETMMY